MLIQTKKYSIKKRRYVALALRYILVRQWWISVLYPAIVAPMYWIYSWWWLIGASTALFLYFFWIIQLVGLTQLQQFQAFFNKVSFEINSQQLLLKVSTTKGMPIQWTQIRKAIRQKHGFVLYMSKVQLIDLPHKVFAKPHQIKIMDTILHRKGYIK